MNYQRGLTGGNCVGKGDFALRDSAKAAPVHASPEGQKKAQSIGIALTSTKGGGWKGTSQILRATARLWWKAGGDASFLCTAA